MRRPPASSLLRLDDVAAVDAAGHRLAVVGTYGDRPVEVARQPFGAGLVAVHQFVVQMREQRASRCANLCDDFALPHAISNVHATGAAPKIFLWDPLNLPICSPFVHM